MARVEQVERRLIEWGDWKRAGGSSAAPAMTAGLTPDGVGQTDGIVATLSGRLQATLTAFYVRRGPMGCHMKQLGCPETTIMRRIGRAHLLIADQLVADRDRERQEQHCSWIASRSGENS